ncbi:MAG TPA: hypothetical protein VHY58_11175 [Streptosporangiaceae bacterium]|jgi:hypothetical protein|nr:hypothetical protein [Streptosporangiaceae bacterium]
MPVNASQFPSRDHRRAARSAWGHRVVQAAVAVAAMATAAPMLIHQPSQPASTASASTPVVHCGELCGLSGRSGLGSG